MSVLSFQLWLVAMDPFNQNSISKVYTTENRFEWNWFSCQIKIDLLFTISSRCACYRWKVINWALDLCNDWKKFISKNQGQVTAVPRCIKVYLYYHQILWNFTSWSEVNHSFHCILCSQEKISRVFANLKCKFMHLVFSSEDIKQNYDYECGYTSFLGKTCNEHACLIWAISSQILPVWIWRTHALNLVSNHS